MIAAGCFRRAVRCLSKSMMPSTPVIQRVPKKHRIGGTISPGSSTINPVTQQLPPNLFNPISLLYYS